MEVQHDSVGPWRFLLKKEAIKAYLEQENIAYHDFGTYSEDSVDYAPIAEQVAHAVANGGKKAFFAAVPESAFPLQPIK